LSFLDTFVAPKPNRLLIRVMTGVTRVFMLKGIPLLRDLWPLNAVPPFRGLANIRHLDFPRGDEARLRAACGPGRATFITPNHPEFFTDWMIDKEVIARVSPLAASWATHTVVNGMGRLAQRFWLANNLIAQIPGKTDAARQHSEAWALDGHGVLLHPEGNVGWHMNYVAPLLPGAVEMALEALEQGRRSNPGFEAWVAPIVWKFFFLDDVEGALVRECGYVEGRLEIGSAGEASGLTLPQRIYRIYDTLLARDQEVLGLRVEPALSFSDRQAAVIEAGARELAGVLAVDGTGDIDDLLRLARRRLRDSSALTPDVAKRLKFLTNLIYRVRRLGPFASRSETLTQEELAEHIKRIRNDYCTASLKDTRNRFLPQPAGRRRAVIRVPKPIALHRFAGSSDEALAELRGRMQAALDGIDADLAPDGRRRYPNPFHQRRSG
jgi:hypothetical protein